MPPPWIRTGKLQRQRDLFMFSKIIVHPWGGEVTGVSTVADAVALLAPYSIARTQTIDLSHGSCLRLFRADGTYIASVFAPRDMLDSILRITTDAKK